MSKIKIALIGAGVMGANHARVISRSQDAELVLVVDPFETNGQVLADAYGARWVPGVNDIPDDFAVVIASATESHFEIASHLIGAGHDVLIEKPLTPSLDLTRDLVSLSESNESVLMCGLLERFNPAVLTAQQFITKPNHIIATRHSPFTPRIKTHVAWDLMVHDVDLVIRLMAAEPDEVSSQSANVRSENRVADITDAILGFHGERLASVSASRVGQRKIRQISVSETDRLTEIDLLRRNVTIYHNVNESPLSNGVGYKQESIIEIPELITSVEPLTAQLEHFVRLIRGEVARSSERSSIIPSHEAIASIVRAT